MIKHLALICLLINATVAQKGGDTVPQKGGDTVPQTGGDAGTKPPGGDAGQTPGRGDAGQMPPGGDGGDAGQKPVDPGPPKKWLTLNGTQPVVIARGGFPGIVPDSSMLGYRLANVTSLPDLIYWCNLQLTKDAAGICLSDIRLDNSTAIATLNPKGQTTYKVNGQDIKGWFVLDYDFKEMFENLPLIQGVMSRPNSFDGAQQILGVDGLVSEVQPHKLWMNVQYDMFYNEHKLSAEKFIEQMLKSVAVNYISSPEVGFLKAIGRKVDNSKTKLVFIVLEPNEVEPTTNQTYGSMLKNLTNIKSFASGIVVPKSYIYPVNNKTKYLEPATTLVTDAHKEGLEVYASGFANDVLASHNYSYDPTAEYLQFIDNSQFAVDGFLTDFPPTASEAVACLAQNNATKPKGGPLIITHNGASGIYPGCTDLAYQQAVDDGADIIDCAVQMSKDGVAFCLDSPDLMGKTTAMTKFMSQATRIPEIQKDQGIFSFDLTWTEIQSLKPEMESPYGKSNQLPRNPEAKNKGKFVTLDEFLELAKAKAVSGILITINNAAYLASKKGLGLVDAVTKALSNATFDKQSTQQVLIESDDTSVLSKFTDIPAYQRVLHLPNEISDAPKEAVEETKKYASAIILRKRSLITNAAGFNTKATKVVQELHSANISVYVAIFRNEFVSLAFDYFSDPIIELATYTTGLGVDGFFTEFPATASKYLRSPCVDPNSNQPYKVIPSTPGNLLSAVPSPMKPPEPAPAPSLKVADIIDPPLPPVANVSTLNPSGSPTGAPGPNPSGVTANIANVGVSLAAIILFCWLSMGY